MRSLVLAALVLGSVLGGRNGESTHAPTLMAQWGPVTKGKGPAPQPTRTPGSNTASDTQRRVGGGTFGAIRK